MQTDTFERNERLGPALNGLISVTSTVTVIHDRLLSVIVLLVLSVSFINPDRMKRMITADSRESIKQNNSFLLNMDWEGMVPKPLNTRIDRLEASIFHEGGRSIPGITHASAKL